MKFFGRQRRNSFDSLSDRKGIEGKQGRRAFNLARAVSTDEDDNNVESRDDAGVELEADNKSISSDTNSSRKQWKRFKTRGFIKSRYIKELGYESDDMSTASDSVHMVNSPHKKAQGGLRLLTRSGSFQNSPRRAVPSPRRWFQKKNDNEKTTISNMGFVGKQKDTEERDDSFGKTVDSTDNISSQRLGDSPRRNVDSANNAQGNVENVLSSGSIKPLLPPRSARDEKEEQRYADTAGEGKILTSGSINPYFPPGLQKQDVEQDVVLKTASSESIKAPPRGVQQIPKQSTLLVKTASSGSFDVPPLGFQQPPTPPRQRLVKSSSSGSIKAALLGLQKPTPPIQVAVKSASSGPIKLPLLASNKQLSSDSVVVEAASSGAIKPPPQRMQPPSTREDEIETRESSLGPKQRQKDLQQELASSLLPPLHPQQREYLTPRNLPIVETVMSTDTSLGGQSGIGIRSMSSGAKGLEIHHDGEFESRSVTTDTQSPDKSSSRPTVSGVQSLDNERLYGFENVVLLPGSSTKEIVDQDKLGHVTSQNSFESIDNDVPTRRETVTTEEIKDNVSGVSNWPHPQSFLTNAVAQDSPDEHGSDKTIPGFVWSADGKVALEMKPTHSSDALHIKFEKMLEKDTRESPSENLPPRCIETSKVDLNSGDCATTTASYDNIALSDTEETHGQKTRHALYHRPQRSEDIECESIDEQGACLKVNKVVQDVLSAPSTEGPPTCLRTDVVNQGFEHAHSESTSSDTTPLPALPSSTSSAKTDSSVQFKRSSSGVDLTRTPQMSEELDVKWEDCGTMSVVDKVVQGVLSVLSTENQPSNSRQVQSNVSESPRNLNSLDTIDKLVQSGTGVLSTETAPSGLNDAMTRNQSRPPLPSHSKQINRKISNDAMSQPEESVQSALERIEVDFDGKPSFELLKNKPVKQKEIKVEVMGEDPSTQKDITAIIESPRDLSSIEHPINKLVQSSMSVLSTESPPRHQSRPPLPSHSKEINRKISHDVMSQSGESVHSTLEHIEVDFDGKLSFGLLKKEPVKQKEIKVEVMGEDPSTQKDITAIIEPPRDLNSIEHPIDKLVQSAMSAFSTETAPRHQSRPPLPSHSKEINKKISNDEMSQSGESAHSALERIEVDFDGKPSFGLLKKESVKEIENRVEVGCEDQNTQKDIAATARACSDPGSYDTFESYLSSNSSSAPSGPRPQHTVSFDEVTFHTDKMESSGENPAMGIRAWFKRQKQNTKRLNRLVETQPPRRPVNFDEQNVEQMEQFLAREPSRSFDEVGPPRKLERKDISYQISDEGQCAEDNVDESELQPTKKESPSDAAPILEATYTKNSEDSGEIQKIDSDSFQAIEALVATSDSGASVTSPPLALERPVSSADVKPTQIKIPATGVTEKGDKPIDPESFQAFEAIVNTKSSSSDVVCRSELEILQKPVVTTLKFPDGVIETRAKSPINFDDVNAVEKMLAEELSQSFTEHAPPAMKALQNREPRKTISPNYTKKNFLEKAGKPWQLFRRNKAPMEEARCMSDEEEVDEEMQEVELTDMKHHEQPNNSEKENTGHEQQKSCDGGHEKSTISETKQEANLVKNATVRSGQSDGNNIIPQTIEDVKSAISIESDIFSGFDSFFNLKKKHPNSSLAIESDLTMDESRTKPSWWHSSKLVFWCGRKDAEHLDHAPTGSNTMDSDGADSVSTWKFAGRKSVLSDLRHSLLSAEEKHAAKGTPQGKLGKLDKSDNSSGGFTLLLFVTIAAIFAALTYTFVKNKYSLLDHDFFVDWEKKVNVAFIGGAYLVINDVPRLTQSLSNGHITQNSVLHPSVGSISRILQTGNGMYYQWQTNEAFITTHRNDYGFNVADYDYGLCTVKQLLLGQDQDILDGETYVNDGRNPCYQDQYYYEKLEEKLSERYTPWNYVVLADQTKRMAIEDARDYTVESLVDTYASMIQYSGAIPVIVDTHAFWSDDVNATGAVDLPSFQLLIYEGALEYAEALASVLPEDQTPLIAPAGLAFLLVYEEDTSEWENLISADGVHASVRGSYLIACVIYATIYGHLPEKGYSTHHIDEIFAKSRKVYDEEITYPTTSEANYYRSIARRVAILGEMPASFAPDEGDAEEGEDEEEFDEAGDGE